MRAALHTFFETYWIERGSNPSVEGRGVPRIVGDVIKELVKLPIFVYLTPMYRKILLEWIKEYEFNGQPPPSLHSD